MSGQSTYVCAQCDEEFDKEWSDEEALAEMTDWWGDVPKEERAVVCDDCWQQMRPDKNPTEYAEYLLAHPER